MTDAEQSQNEHDHATLDKIKGKAKETVGGLLGDNSTKLGGKLDSLKGKAEDGIADLKDRLHSDRTDDTK